MLSSIFIALLQAVAGDPAAATEAPASETTAPATTPAAPRTERRRVCETHAAATGGRLQARRCRWEEVPVEDAATPEEDAAEHDNHEHAGGHAGSAPAPQPN